ncbi:regulatory signaling modulator protein AmpE [Alkalimonas sp. NCh-2]|uniref:regulatory signaling modulator protein AmpE n=1 Tax=Alkalimonas sp. NCh-2 TaxID=3144846 RepID=UPI0031F66814
MTLVSMLLALIIERLAARSELWQGSRYVKSWFSLTAGSKLAEIAKHPIGQYAWILLPGFLVWLLLRLIDLWLLTTLVNTLLLLLAIGCWHYRQLYKQFLNAQDRNDDEAAFLAMQQIRQHSGLQSDDASYGQSLIWLNFRYYAAVLFWFLPFGAFGIITYVILRQLNQPSYSEDPQMLQLEALLQQEHEGTPAYQRLMHIADWFPARLFGIGFALVGYFSRASSALLGYFLDFTSPNEQVVLDVATAAEPIDESILNTAEETATMVQLAKRNILFFLALTAILTLAGWLG